MFFASMDGMEIINQLLMKYCLVSRRLKT